MTERRIAMLSSAAGGLALFIDAVYVRFILSQAGGTGPEELRFPFIAGFIGALALGAFAGWWLPHRSARPAVLAFVASGLLLLGLFGLFSIGLPLMLVGVAAAIAAILSIASAGTSRSVLFAAAGALVAVFVLVVGIYETELPVGCGSMATSRGGGSSLLRGDYSYTCDRGHFTLRQP